jgi:hypothetical protein
MYMAINLIELELELEFYVVLSMVKFWRDS